MPPHYNCAAEGQGGTTTARPLRAAEEQKQTPAHIGGRQAFARGAQSVRLPPDPGGGTPPAAQPSHLNRLKHYFKIAVNNLQEDASAVSSISMLQNILIPALNICFVQVKNSVRQSAVKSIFYQYAYLLKYKKPQNEAFLLF